MTGHHLLVGIWLAGTLTAVGSGAAAQTDELASAAAAADFLPTTWQPLPVGSMVAFIMKVR